VKPRAILSLTLTLLGLLVSLPAGALPAGAPPPDDPLAPFLRDLADSTDAFFGRTAVAFDTTGIDSLIRTRSTEKPKFAAPRGASVHFFPVLAYHRATGPTLGAGVQAGYADRIRAEFRGGYGFGNKEGRYGASLARALFRRKGGRDRGRLWLMGRYARETLTFAPEHARTLESTVAALTTGRNQQSVFERRAAEVGLRWEAASTLGEIGWRAARDESMPTVTLFSLWGADRGVPPVTSARSGAYREGFVEIAHAPRGSTHLGAEARYTARHRWRTRVAGARRVGFAGLEANLQAEAGFAAHRGPPQDRFELGGPVAIPSLRCGDEAGNRLVLGKIELVHGLDLLRALHVPHPSLLVLHPGLFVQEGAAWTGQDGSWNGPARESRRGAAGVELVHLPGIPNPATFIRFQIAWPLGRRSGVPRFSMALGRWHDLAPSN
jgi:hypothetical protein